MATPIRQKKTFGGGEIRSIGPKVIDADTDVVRFNLDFDGALRLKAAVDEAVATMNRHDRSTRKGRRAGLWVACHRKKMRFTLGPRNLVAPKEIVVRGGR